MCCGNIFRCLSPSCPPPLESVSSYSPGFSETHYASGVSLAQVAIPLPQPPAGWDYKCVPACLVASVAGEVGL